MSQPQLTIAQQVAQGQFPHANEVHMVGQVYPTQNTPAGWVGRGPKNPGGDGCIEINVKLLKSWTGRNPGKKQTIIKVIAWGGMAQHISTIIGPGAIVEFWGALNVSNYQSRQGKNAGQWVTSVKVELPKVQTGSTLPITVHGVLPVVDDRPPQNGGGGWGGGGGWAGGSGNWGGQQQQQQQAQPPQQQQQQNGWGGPPQPPAQAPAQQQTWGAPPAPPSAPPAAPPMPPAAPWAQPGQPPAPPAQQQQAWGQPPAPPAQQQQAWGQPPAHPTAPPQGQPAGQGAWGPPAAPAAGNAAPPPMPEEDIPF